MLSCAKLYFKICGSILAPSKNIQDSANKPYNLIFTKGILIFPHYFAVFHFFKHTLQKNWPENLFEWPEKKIFDLLHKDESTFCNCIFCFGLVFVFLIA